MLQAMLRAHRSSAADAEQQAAAERAEAEARQQEAAATAAVREAALVVQRRYRARRAAQQASDLANRQKVRRLHAVQHISGWGLVARGPSVSAIHCSCSCSFGQSSAHRSRHAAVAKLLALRTGIG